MPRVVITIPCFNEAGRLRDADPRSLLQHDAVEVLFVDDGSTDGTGELLANLAAQAPARARVLSLARNAGKGEAVRLGMTASAEAGADVVGYVDADMATPAAEVHRLVDRMLDGDSLAVIGSRVAMLGAEIERRPARHYLGRLFATAASLALGVPVYDTQCGAKLFRVTDELRRALARPFSSRWAFDVELLGRLLSSAGTDRIVEVPLFAWKDPGMSRLSARAMLRAGLDLVVIAVKLRRDEAR